MLRWIRDIYDAIKWARRMMLTERKDSAFVAKISYFISGTIWPASLRYKEEHGHTPKYLLLPMDRLSDVHRIMDLRQYNLPKDDNKLCGIEAVWNGEEGEDGWSFSDENPHVEK